MAITSEVGLHHIQKQIDNCDNIVDKIDSIVPLLYKARQQALAQKEYINDAQRVLLTSGLSAVDGTSKAVTIHTTAAPLTNIVTTSLATKAYLGNADIAQNTAEQRQVFQSFFKFKHDCGTSNHFTTEQIGLTTDRTHGLNLEDAHNLLCGMESLLKFSNQTPAVATADLKKILLKVNTNANNNVAPAAAATSLIGTLGANTYTTSATQGLTSLLVPVALAETDTGSNAATYIGFGLT